MDESEGAINLVDSQLMDKDVWSRHREMDVVPLISPILC